MKFYYSGWHCACPVFVLRDSFVIFYISRSLYCFLSNCSAVFALACKYTGPAHGLLFRCCWTGSKANRPVSLYVKGLVPITPDHCLQLIKASHFQVRLCRVLLALALRLLANIAVSAWWRAGAPISRYYRDHQHGARVALAIEHLSKELHPQSHVRTRILLSGLSTSTAPAGGCKEPRAGGDV